MQVLNILPLELLEVAPLSSYIFPLYIVEADRIELWHPEASLNEVRAEALTSIPAGSRVTVGNTEYTRVIRGWLEEEYCDISEYAFSRFIPDPGVEDKAPDRWRVDCNNHSGTPCLLKGGPEGAPARRERRPRRVRGRTNIKTSKTGG